MVFLKFGGSVVSHCILCGSCIFEVLKRSLPPRSYGFRFLLNADWIAHLGRRITPVAYDCQPEGCEVRGKSLRDSQDFIRRSTTHVIANLRRVLRRKSNNLGVNLELIKQTSFTQIWMCDRKCPIFHGGVSTAEFDTHTPKACHLFPRFWLKRPNIITDFVLRKTEFSLFVRSKVELNQHHHWT